MSYRFGVISSLSKFLTLCVFEPLFGGGLGATYDVHVRFIRKRVVIFEHVSLSVTAEALRAKIDRKSADGSVSDKPSRGRGRPHQLLFARMIILRSLESCVVDFLLVLIELFFARCYG